jgi:beta-galactosidase
LEDFGPRSWARPEVLGVGRLPSTRLLVPFPDEEAASAASDERDSPWHVDLGGRWRFRLRGRPEDVIVDDLCGPSDGEGWTHLDVPGPWTMQGHDRPHYTNVQMPIPGPPPAVPDANPTGVHRRTVVVPEGWVGRRTVLHVGGAESVLFVHVDGEPVAMGKDSRLPHEVDLTDHLVPGRPAELALTVVRWSDATYLEDQDHWHHGGLHRDVVLYATEPVHVAALQTVADLEPDSGAGHLRVRVQAEATAVHPPKGWRAQIRLVDPDGCDALDEPLAGELRWEHPTDWVVSFLVFEGRGTTIEATVPRVRPWSTEVPDLYRLLVTLVDDQGHLRGTVTERIGFRRVEVRGAELLVNGRPVLVRGVNRHDHDPRTGKAVSREAMRADLLAMKRHNLDAVRTSHYPAPHHLYELCDELGLHVVDEANLETHAYMRSLTKDPAWAPAILDRVTRMAQRDVDHPCVIAWSLGNESGTSPVLDAAAAWLRSFDPTRPVQYEGDLSEARFAALARGDAVGEADLWRRPQPASDLLVPMYPPIDQLVRWATGCPPDRPLVMCEYQHAMGNSCGSMADYWEAIRSHDGLQGGFVWDWMDQGLLKVLVDGTARWAYGGDFGDEPNDGTFCINGLVGPDRDPHPSLLELAACVAPVRIEPTGDGSGTVVVRSERTVTDLSDLVPSLEVLVDGEQRSLVELEPVPLGPGEATAIDLPGVPVLAPGEVAHCTIRFAQAGDRPWAPAGHVVACAQVELARAGREVPVDPGAPRSPVASAELAGPDESDESDHPEGARRANPAAPSGPSGPSGPAATVDPATGALRVDGLVEGPRLVLWRAPTDNDLGASPSPAERWRSWGLDRLELGHRSVEPADGVVAIVERLRGGEGIEVDHRIELRSLGDSVHVSHLVELAEPLDDLARVGVRFTFAPGHEQVDWLGRGPHEGYTDRCASTIVGRWQTAVDDWPVRYVHPQATGNRTGVRGLRLLGDGRGGVEVVADDELQVTVAHHTDEDLAAAAHADEVPRRPETYLWLDAAHRGVGTGACGPDTLDHHRVQGGTHRWSYTLRPLP